MRVLIVGGAGFIGPHVVQGLAEQGHDITVFHRRQAPAGLPATIRHLSGDRRDLATFRSAFAEVAPDVVLDMIPMTEEDARLLVSTLKGQAGRVVAISSCDVYRAFDRLRLADPGPPDPTPLTEDAPLRDRLHPYRETTPRPAGDPQRWLDDYDKILVERVVLGDPDLPGTVLRLPMVYGPGDRQHRLFPYLKRMDDGRRTIVLDENAARVFFPRGYVEDVASAIALALVDDKAAGHIYNVAEEKALVEAEWVRQVGRAAGWEGDIVTAPPARLPAHLRAALDPRQPFTISAARIRRELGYAEVVPGDEALRRTIAWERANPPAQIDPRQFDYAAEDAVLAELGRS